MDYYKATNYGGGAKWLRAWTLEPDCLDLNSGSYTHLLHDPGKGISPLSAQISLLNEKTNSACITRLL